MKYSVSTSHPPTECTSGPAGDKFTMNTTYLIHLPVAVHWAGLFVLVTGLGLAVGGVIWVASELLLMVFRRAVVVSFTRHNSICGAGGLQPACSKSRGKRDISRRSLGRRMRSTGRPFGSTSERIAACHARSAPEQAHDPGNRRMVGWAPLAGSAPLGSSQ